MLSQGVEREGAQVPGSENRHRVGLGWTRTSSSTWLEQVGTGDRLRAERTRTVAWSHRISLAGGEVL